MKYAFIGKGKTFWFDHDEKKNVSWYSVHELVYQVNLFLKEEILFS